jgi:hypothetical protein
LLVHPIFFQSWKKTKTNQFVHDNGGFSNVTTPIKNRPDWEEVEKVLKGERPASDLGCN